MEIDYELCERARKSRDHRFDGRFFVAVKSTGIYCRPICPAPAAKRANVVYYSCAAAAEEAGFRPCMRCRPEAAPGTPAWVGTSATVSRAVRLISEGALDDGSVDDLAARVGIGSRHLRRLFIEHLGATPQSIAKTRRVHFASRLLQETTLPMTHVAQGAGFSSLRRFNSLLREVYGRSPSDLRRVLTEGDEIHPKPLLELRLPYRPPYAWGSMIGFLRARAVAGVEAVDGHTYRRSFRLDDATGILEVEPDLRRHTLVLRIHSREAAPLFRIVDRVRRMFDLCSDPRTIDDHLAKSPILGDLVASGPGMRVPGSWDPFELAIRAVLGQQVSVQAVRTLAGRLARKYGTPLSTADTDGISLLFPTPGQLAEADVESAGITGKRAETIRVVSRAACDGFFSRLAGCDLEDMVKQWTALPGIGRWTAQYIAMRAFKEPDAMPEGDLGLLRALGAGGDCTPARLEKEAEAWRPWRAYATIYLWTKGESR